MNQLLNELLIHYDNSHQRLARTLNITIATLQELLNNKIQPTENLQQKIKNHAITLRLIK